MTDDYKVSQLIEDIGATSSRIEKEELVRELASTELGAFVLKWAYNPFITFGITAAPTEGRGKMTFKPSLVESLLDRLAKRELTGHAAEREIGEVMSFLDERGARLLFLILSKDLKCGIAESTINAAVPGMIPSFSVMRAHIYEPKRIKHGFKAEFKLDGQRNTFLCKDGHGGFFTRSGKIVPALDFLVPTVIKAAVYAVQKNDRLRKMMLGDREGGRENLNFMLDGEAMMGLFEETGKLRKKDAAAVGAELHLYDIMSYEDFDAPGEVGDPLHVRRQDLQAFVALAKELGDETIQIVPQFFVNTDDDVQALFLRSRSMTLASYMARGDTEKEAQLLKTTIDKATGKPKVLEGIVVKDPDALYKKSKSYAWLKLKAEETEDLPITGAYPGEPHTRLENCLGGLQVDYKGVPVNVGGGYSDDEREEIWKLWQEDLANGKLEIEPKPNNKKLFVYTPNAGYAPKLVRRLIEVEYMEETPDGSLRHNRYVRFRDDKAGELECRKAA
ncbi:MAG: hypothetical protein DI537_14725 [Stutzerimonas stutzeri]|nr:MAG: hypothetical protein DI537_14725 [Stutzerimonas stutzeri]